MDFFRLKIFHIRAKLWRPTVQECRPSAYHSLSGPTVFNQTAERNITEPIPLDGSLEVLVVLVSPLAWFTRSWGCIVATRRRPPAGRFYFTHPLPPSLQRDTAAVVEGIGESDFSWVGQIDLADETNTDSVVLLQVGVVREAGQPPSARLLAWQERADEGGVLLQQPSRLGWLQMTTGMWLVLDEDTYLLNWIVHLC